MKSRKYLLLLMLFLPLVSYSCKDEIIKPVEGEKPGRRDFTWAIDTIKNPNGFNVTPQQLWGTSSSDVWAIGFDDVYLSDIYHYNGKIWERKTPSLGLNVDFPAIYGFSENDVYFAGYSYNLSPQRVFQTLIVHYDGKNWRKENIPKAEGGLKYMWGRNNKDIWACGVRGSLYHYNGTEWKYYPQDPKLDLGPIFGTGTDDVFIISRTNDYQTNRDTVYQYFSSIENGKLIQKDSNRLVYVSGIGTGFKFGEKSLWGTSKNNLYSVADKIYHYDGNSWKMTGWTYNDVLDVRGTGEKNIFVVGYHGFINHYNGADWYTIEEYTNTIADFYAVQPFNDAVFIIANYRGSTYIVRGMLK